ncbi:hypothetical protein AB1Y20_001158 [Prymnesium parvum]|uniref:Uncharacterized protein n=1 Tax=Prymnesium parvum TaxID=97485 RepID=A0AB34KAG1_PRYPA
MAWRSFLLLRAACAMKGTDMSSTLSPRRNTTLRNGNHVVHLLPHKQSVVTHANQSCLEGAKLFFMGFSEVGRQVSWLHNSLNCSRGPDHPKFGGPATINGWISKCMGPGAHSLFLKKAKAMLSLRTESDGATARDEALRGNAENIPLRDALCREYFFGVAPVKSRCPLLNLSMTFRWKSFQSDAYDEASRGAVVAAANRNSNVFVILEGGGPHHFTKFPDHRYQDSWANKDFTDWPQHWIDDWIASTRQLFRTFSPRSLPANVCVVHKKMNIAPRVEGTHQEVAMRHHPSTAGGFHHWLNRISSALGLEEGIPSLDLSQITRSTSPKGATGCNDSSRSGIKCASSDGDPYHGFPPGRLGRELLRQMCTSCRAQCGVSPLCELPIGQTEGDFRVPSPK